MKRRNEAVEEPGVNSQSFIVLIFVSNLATNHGAVVSPLRPRGRAAEKYHGGALALDESRAAPVRSGWAGATERPRGARGTGGKCCAEDETM